MIGLLLRTIGQIYETGFRVEARGAAEEGDVAFAKHTRPPKCPECGRLMEYCEFPVMLAIDVEHQVQPPLWLCRHCWRVRPSEPTTRSRASARADRAASR
jgi:hypothetical protein